MINKYEEYFGKYPFAELSSQDAFSKLRFCTYTYEFPEITKGYDADWHRNLFVLTIPGFRAEINDSIYEGYSLSYFLKELEDFSALKKEKIEFKPTEPYFGIELSFSSLKKVIVKGFVQYPVGGGAELEYEFETDLTYIDSFKKGIKMILNEFPVRR